MNWLKLAFRNILRNKRRSLITIIAIGVGFTSVSLYQGYTHNAYESLRWLALCGEGLGHLRINKTGWQDKGRHEPEKYLLSKEETEKIIRLATEEKEVVLATPQLQVIGTVSNGITSSVFIAQGVVPKNEDLMKKIWREKIDYIDEDYHEVIGEELRDGKKYGVLIAKDLAGYLNMRPGDNGIVMAQTFRGQMNAMDMQINGIFDTGNDFSNDKLMRFPFPFAQALLDTKSADTVLILLARWQDTERMRDLLFNKLRQEGIDCEIRTWKELSLGYSKMKSYLDTIFIFLFSIVMVIVVVTTINTMGMTVLERTKEIGTMRAIGLKRKGVNRLFVLEGALLGLCGSIVGIFLHSFMWIMIRIFPFQYTPPGFSTPLAMRVDMVPGTLVALTLGFMFLSMIAAILPARRIAGKNIVDALGHS